MIENVDFDIKKMLFETPESWVGCNKADFATLFVFGFDYNGKAYAVYAAFDCGSDTSAFIVCDYDTDTVQDMKLIKGGK